jgi:AraC-like DNA-binding protein
MREHRPGSADESPDVLEAVSRRKGGVTPDALSVARDLGVGIRVLQLKLKEEGTSFRKLLDASQAEMAQEYLKDTALGIKEIAYLLGFSDSRAFHWAFLRWTGRTPGEMKRALSAGASEGERLRPST